jgi:hypothetical protein
MFVQSERPFYSFAPIRLSAEVGLCEKKKEKDKSPRNSAGQAPSPPRRTGQAAKPPRRKESVLGRQPLRDEKKKNSRKAAK